MVSGECEGLMKSCYSLQWQAVRVEGDVLLTLFSIHSSMEVRETNIDSVGTKNGYITVTLVQRRLK